MKTGGDGPTGRARLFAEESAPDGTGGVDSWLDAGGGARAEVLDLATCDAGSKVYTRLLRRGASRRPVVWRATDVRGEAAGEEPACGSIGVREGVWQRGGVSAAQDGGYSGKIARKRGEWMTR